MAKCLLEQYVPDDIITINYAVLSIMYWTFTGDSKTLFVKNLVEDITEEDIREFFEGESITEIRLPKKYDGSSKG